jgi:plastocyanin domain-containing protein
MKSILTIVAVAGLLTAAATFAQGPHSGHTTHVGASGTNTPGAQRVQIAVTADGFVPELTKIKVDEPVTLLVTRTVERTCATEIVIKEYGINKPLPLNETVEVTFTPKKPGKIRFACAMDMIAGELVAE